MACAVLCTTLLWRGDLAGAHTPHDDIGDIAVSPAYPDDHTVFVISRGRLMRSTDGGTTWREIVRGLGDEGQRLARVAVAPSEPRVLYLTTRDDGVLRSGDGGTTWRPANGGLNERNFQELAVSPACADVAIVAPNTAEGGLFRTADGGASWSAVGPSGRVTSLAFLPDGRRVVAGDARGRVTTSRDAGATWDSPVTLDEGHAVSAVAVGPAGEQADIVFAATASGRLFRSDDGGGEFAALGDGLPDEEVRSLELSPTYPDDATLWASTWHSGVYVSTDRGETWDRMGDGLTTNSQADDVGVPQFRTVAAAEGPGRYSLFVGGFDGLFRFDDREGSWTPIETLADHIVGLAVSPSFADDRTVAVTTYAKGAFLSRDGGDTWSYANDGLRDDVGNTFVPLQRLHNVTFSPDYGDDGTIFSANWGKVLRSTDRGRSWQAITVSPPPPGDRLRQFVIAVSPAFASDRTAFAATRHGEVFRSEDGGDPGTWERLGGFDEGERVRSLAVSPDYTSDRTLYAGTVGGVHSSDDGGRTWSATGPRMATPPEGGEDDLGALVAVSPDYGSDGTVFAGTDGGLFVTRDGGRSWVEVTVPPLTTSSQVEAVAVSPAYAQDRTVLVSTRELGLLRSTDGGRSFRRIGVDLLDANRIVADFTNPTSMPIQFSPSFASDRTVFAYAQTDVLRSTDGGETWKVLPLPSSREVLERVGPAPGPQWFETPIGRLSRRRVLAAVGAGVVAFAVVSALRVGGRRTGPALALHFGVGLAVLAVALVVLAG